MTDDRQDEEAYIEIDGVKHPLGVPAISGDPTTKLTIEPPKPTVQFEPGWSMRFPDGGSISIDGKTLLFHGVCEIVGPDGDVIGRFTSDGTVAPA
jgi:hypothetical protein